MSRLTILLLAITLFTGCHEDASWSVSITTYSESSAAYTGTEVGVTAMISSSNTTVWIDAENWDVISAPGAFVLADYGHRADFTGLAPGDYVLRYRAWYWIDDGRYYSQESFVVITVLAAPAG